MKKVTIALLLLATMPLNGTKPRKPHRIPSRAQYQEESAKLRTKINANNYASIAQRAIEEERWHTIYRARCQAEQKFMKERASTQPEGNNNSRTRSWQPTSLEEDAYGLLGCLSCGGIACCLLGALAVDKAAHAVNNYLNATTLK